jgi:hypothetical protein
MPPAKLGLILNVARTGLLHISFPSFGFLLLSFLAHVLANFHLLFGARLWGALLFFAHA